MTVFTALQPRVARVCTSDQCQARFRFDGPEWACRQRKPPSNPSVNVAGFPLPLCLDGVDDPVTGGRGSISRVGIRTCFNSVAFHQRGGAGADAAPDLLANVSAEVEQIEMRARRPRRMPASHSLPRFFHPHRTFTSQHIHKMLWDCEPWLSFTPQCLQLDYKKTVFALSYCAALPNFFPPLIIFSEWLWFS